MSSSPQAAAQPDIHAPANIFFSWSRTPGFAARAVKASLDRFQGLVRGLLLWLV
jgi:hypothetical protein